MNKTLVSLMLMALVVGARCEETPETSETGGIVDGFTEEDLSAMEKSKEEHPFQADVSRVLDILINSLYSNKDIFIREAISNAADALDKIRFLSVQSPEILESKKDLGIWIETDADAKTISITDSGIGMTRSDLINNLGTIARTDTIRFLEDIAKEGNLNLIGQFGVGFYSLFLVGNKITVTSKHNDDDQHVWESVAGSSFSITKDPRGNTLGRGTRITIQLKQDAHEFVETEKIKKLIQHHSEFINFPIKLHIKKEVSKEVEVTEEEDFTDETTKDEKKDEMEITDDADKKPEEKKKTKTIKETVWDWERINDSKAIWLKPKEEIEEEEYSKFYKSITKDYDDPLTHIHFKVEGDVEFSSILYIPKKAPKDLFQENNSRILKLYVRRVLISDKFDELLPRFLNFIRGIVDSDDIPLNVSRENLQQMKTIKAINRKLTRKVLEMIRKMATAADEVDEQPDEDMTDSEKEEFNKKKEQRKTELLEKYEKFWSTFGKNIKLGIIENPGNRSKLAKLCRFYSSYNADKLTSFDDYIDRAKKSQDSIYFISGDDKKQLIKSPIIQGLVRKGYEVLLLDDPIDEYALSHLNEYDDKKLVNVAKSNFKFPEDEDDKNKLKKLKKLYQPLTTWLSDKFKEKVERVEVSLKLVEDPIAIVASEHGYSASMEKLARAQASAEGNANQWWQNMKKILEINPYHPFIREVLERVKAGAEPETEETFKVLYDVALMNAGKFEPRIFRNLTVFNFSRLPD